MGRTIQSIAVLCMFAALCSNFLGDRYMRVMRLLLGFEFMQIIIRMADEAIHFLN